MFRPIRLTLAGLLALASHAVLAAGNPLSVHVLDLQNGQPTPGISVDLEQKTATGWRSLASGVTDAQGRIRELFPAGQPFVAGQYRVVFHTGAHYATVKQPTFFPEIPVLFKVEDATQHYHIPLLLSPYGYSTYRGN
jgi:5-hydroxyisourate hydrolase